MQAFLDVNNIAFTVLGYQMSWLELWATVFGAVAVWLSAKENIWSWVIGLVNVSLAFVMFYQIQLYPDMFLQIFFFITNIIGFWQWKFPAQGNANQKNELKISKLSPKNILVLSLIGMMGTVLLGTFSNNLHEIIPALFSLPSSFPYLDSFTTIMSVIATFLLIRKYVESWWIWLIVDVIYTYMYYVKEVKLYALLYFAFVIIAAFGAWEWTINYRKQQMIEKT